MTVHEVAVIPRKTCRNCGESQPLAQFYSHPRTVDRKQSWCKTCIRAATEERRRNGS